MPGLGVDDCVLGAVVVHSGGGMGVGYHHLEDVSLCSLITAPHTRSSLINLFGNPGTPTTS